MATLEEIVVQLTAESSQLRAEMKSASKATEDAAKKMEEAIKAFSDNSSKNTSFFQTAMATMTGFLGSQAVMGVVETVKDAFAELGHQLAEGVADANAEEDAMKRLSTAMALSGKFSVTAAEGLREFAGEMEATTGVQDQVILGNLALLSSLTKLDSGGLKKAQQAAMDLSSAIGIDLDSATRMVAKGIEGHTSAFQRYGIQIQAGTNQTENFANVVGALTKQFGGSAAGNLQTFSGGVLKLQNSFHNMVEVIGRVITNNAALKSVISSLADVFTNLEKYITSNADAISSGLTTAVNACVIGLAGLADLLGKCWGAMKLLYNGVMVVVQGMMDLYQAAEAIKRLDFSGAADAFKETGEHIQAVNDIIEGKTSNVFLDLRDKIISVGEKSALAGDMQKKAFEDAKPAIDNQKIAVDQLSNAFYNFRQATQESQSSYVKGLLDQAATFDNVSTIQNDTLQAQHDAGLISFQEYTDGKMAVLQQSQQAEADLLQSYRDKGTLTEQQYLIAQAQMQAKQSNDSVKLAAETEKTKMDNLKSTFSTIASLSSSSSRELAAIGKAAAIAQATIDGYAAVQKALASAPPPFNFALAGVVGVATAANVAKIAGVGLKSGIDSVPGQGTADIYPAMLAPDERVVPAKSNQDLTAFLDEQKNGGGAGKSIVINMNFSSIVAPNREQVAVIIEAINDTLAANASLRIIS